MHFFSPRSQLSLDFQKDAVEVASQRRGSPSSPEVPEKKENALRSRLCSGLRVTSCGADRESSARPHKKSSTNGCLKLGLLSGGIGVVLALDVLLLLGDLRSDRLDLRVRVKPVLQGNELVYAADQDVGVFQIVVRLQDGRPM